MRRLRRPSRLLPQTSSSLTSQVGLLAALPSVDASEDTDPDRYGQALDNWLRERSSALDAAIRASIDIEAALDEILARHTGC